jgi:tetratricopeptide (TPR) repeat protein
LKQAAGERMMSIKDRMLQAFRDGADNDGFFVKWLADLLRGYKLGIGHENEIAQKLVLLAGVFKLQNDFYRTREYYETASYWFNKVKNEEEAVKAIACQADAWHTEANLKELSGDFIGAAHGLEKAIQIYHQIPKKYRSGMGVEDKLPQLRLHLNKTGKMAADAMQFICTPPVDITEVVNQSRKLIQEKTPTEALKILANIYPGAVRTKIRSSAEQTLTQFHFGSFFGLSVRTRDGRIVAKNPGMAVAEKGSDEYEAEAWKEMLKSYYLEIGLAVSRQWWQSIACRKKILSSSATNHPLFLLVEPMLLEKLFLQDMI